MVCACMCVINSYACLCMVCECMCVINSYACLCMVCACMCVVSSYACSEETDNNVEMQRGGGRTYVWEQVGTG